MTSSRTLPAGATRAAPGPVAPRLPAGEDAGARPEWAIAAGVPEIQAAEASGDLQPAERGWSATLYSGEPVVFQRLYAGEEFCRHLIPGRTRWRSLLALAERRGVPVTLTTPPATEDDLARLSVLFRMLSGSPGAEVVANDWGVLSLVRRRFPDLRPLLGRGLRRQRKDPRSKDLAHPGAMARELQDLLAHLGVDRVEADWLPDDASPIPLVMHVPFAFLASGSLCALSGLNRPVYEKFRPDQPCAAPCRGLRAQLRHAAFSAPVLLKGNTLFGQNGVGLASAARPDVARLVYDLDTDVERRFLRPTPEARRP